MIEFDARSLRGFIKTLGGSVRQHNGTAANRLLSNCGSYSNATEFQIPGSNGQMRFGAGCCAAQGCRGRAQVARWYIDRVQAPPAQRFTTSDRQPAKQCGDDSAGRAAGHRRDAEPSTQTFAPNSPKLSWYRSGPGAAVDAMQACRQRFNQRLRCNR
jgi:hypothetical protein